MKKILAGIAVLAFVAAAQAELLNTWTFSAGKQASNTPNGEANNIGQVKFGNLTLDNLTAGATGAVSGNPTFSSYGWTTGSAVNFTLDVNPDYEIAGASVKLQGINAVNGGPTPLQWKLNGTDVGDAWTVSSGTAVISDAKTASFGDIAAGNYVVALTYSGTGRIGSSTATASSTANVRMFNNLEFYGDVKDAGQTSVPEPATMSLLGLGALAMVIRRKLRK
jgi:hypothetical protein